MRLRSAANPAGCSAETIRALLGCTADRPIALYRFTCAPVGAGCWLVHHYLTREGGRP